MPYRSSAQTLLVLLGRLFRERMVFVVAFAREFGIDKRTVTKYMDTLAASCVPLACEPDEDERDECWCVPPSWAPDGVLLSTAVARQLMCLLATLPSSPPRDEALDALRAAIRGARDPREIIVGEAADAAVVERTSSLVEAASARVAVRFRQLGPGSSSGALRRVSPHRVLLAPPRRLLMTCHATGALEVLPIDLLVEVRREPAEAFRAPDLAALDALIATLTDTGPTSKPANDLRSRVA